MNCQKLLQRMIGVMLVVLPLVGCGAPGAAPVSEAPAATSTPIPSATTPTPEPPIATPTPVPPTATSVPPTATPAPKTIPTQTEPPPTASSPPTEQVYYVAANEPNASDDNSGLYPTYQGGQDGPWLTIQHAANTMTEGETTYVRAVSYDNGVAGFAINSDSHHVVYHNNVAWRNGAAWAGQGAADGFYCYNGCWHVEWYNNASLENSNSGFGVEDQIGIYGTPGDNLLVFKNNIAYNNNPEGETWGVALGIAGDNTWQVVSTHNDWSVPPGSDFAVENQGTGYSPQDINRGAFQTGNISIDPQFVDATVPDVHLLPDSPCIDAGVDVGLPYLGSAPDMGAFEFGR